MARRPWRRRSIIIGAIIVALSIGIVFASLPYLQPPNTAHGSIRSTLSHLVDPGTSSHVGFYGLRLPNRTTSERFSAGVHDINGTASLSVPEYDKDEDEART